MDNRKYLGVGAYQVSYWANGPDGDLVPCWYLELDPSTYHRFDVRRGGSHLSRAVAASMPLRRKNYKLSRAIACVVTNLSDVLSRHARGLCFEPLLSIPLSEKSALYKWKHSYGASVKGKWLGHSAVREAVRLLVTNGWVEIKTKGHSTGDAQVSLVRPTDALIELWRGISAKLGRVWVETEPDLSVNFDDVKVKPRRGEASVQLSAEMEAIRRQMNRQLREFNQLQKTFTWSLERLDLIPGLATDLLQSAKGTRGIIRPGCIHYSRVFVDGTLDRGGRFYATISSGIPRHLRRHIRVNGEPLIEADFSAMHVYCVYALAGVAPPADVYSKGRLASVYRPAVKAVMLNMLNWGKLKRDGGVSLSGFHGSVQDAWNESRRKDEAERKHRELLGLPVDGEPLPEKLDPKLIDECREAILTEHAPICELLMSDWGTRLQFIDSRVAERVMRRFVELKAPLFVLHDGFYSTAKFREELVATMQAGFQEVLGVAWLPPVKVKPL